MADISIRELAQTLAAIDNRTAQIDRKIDHLAESLDTLSRMTARMPDGRTLINVVGTILNDIESH